MFAFTCTIAKDVFNITGCFVKRRNILFADNTVAQYDAIRQEHCRSLRRTVVYIQLLKLTAEHIFNYDWSVHSSLSSKFQLTHNYYELHGTVSLLIRIKHRHAPL